MIVSGVKTDEVFGTHNAVGDLDWTKPYLDEAEVDIHAGRVVPLDNHLARVRDVLAKLKTG